MANETTSMEYNMIESGRRHYYQLNIILVESDALTPRNVCQLYAQCAFICVRLNKFLTRELAVEKPETLCTGWQVGLALGSQLFLPLALLVSVTNRKTDVSFCYSTWVAVGRHNQVDSTSISNGNSIFFKMMLRLYNLIIILINILFLYRSPRFKYSNGHLWTALLIEEHYSAQ